MSENVGKCRKMSEKKIGKFRNRKKSENIRKIREIRKTKAAFFFNTVTFDKNSGGKKWETQAQSPKARAAVCWGANRARADLPAAPMPDTGRALAVQKYIFC